MTMGDKMGSISSEDAKLNYIILLLTELCAAQGVKLPFIADTKKVAETIESQVRDAD